MQDTSVFQIYNASAGSGKTFTLVKEYLKILLQSKDIFYFQKVLAVTFTNKAAGEMKERVLKNLNAFSNGESTDMLELILQETPIDVTIIKERSQKVLNAILQNYSAFSITTIDSFTHKIIKNFAYDLGLTLNFEVEMDAVSLLNEAVDILVSKIGVRNDITKLLIEYSASKIDEDKSWDVSFELKEFSKVLLREDDVKHFRKLSQKTVGDFNALQDKLKKSKKEAVKRLKEIGARGLEVISTMNLDHKDFYYSLIPKHFTALQKDPLQAKFFDQSKLKERIEENMFYSKSKSEDIKSAIDGILPELLNLYFESEKIFQDVLLQQLALKSLVPLAVLNNVNKELNTIKEENNIRLNAEFNQLISDHIKDQPTPYIYERIGQRFMHYFIDEMQDTSILQWQNLIPLIDNALAQESSSLLLVGDAKQAIYRWRGGKAEQLINLSSSENVTFNIEKELKLLGRNFRSYSEVINFNNDFFQHVATLFSSPNYKELFIEGNQQQENSKTGGCVSISFLEKKEDKEEEKNKYPEKVYQQIVDLQKEYALSEISVLVRKKKEGIAVANYLSEKGIPIVSSETLLLANSNKVLFIINFLKLVLYPNDEQNRFELLCFLHKHLQTNNDLHTFLTDKVKCSLLTFIELLNGLGTNFKLELFNTLPFYEKIEYIIRGFSLLETSDAYVQFFLDLVLDQQGRGVTIQDFLDFWSSKKDNLSIATPDESEAVKIMTIHKSKGLEFPVVIFPFDLDIYRQVKPKVWFHNLSNDFLGFEELLIDYSKSLEYINDLGKEIYHQQRQELELDNFNLLYVALTRSVEQLHIITEKRLTKSGENMNYYSGAFISYLKKVGRWEEDVNEYVFGESKRNSEKVVVDTNKLKLQDQFISTSWQDHNIVLLSSASKVWNTDAEEAVAYGNITHDILSKIKTNEDVDEILSFYKSKGDLDVEVLDNLAVRIRDIINHPKLTYFYSDEVTVVNEREIRNDMDEIIIPDRLVFYNNMVTVIDYKTGKPDRSHMHQINKYANDLGQLNFKVDKKILIYINDEILVEEIA
ncbi:exodeoxyribonuclease V subunit beta [uncultured Tenacibaculum sp.]|uniref:UvrD-helicase domain-containing protein n=1 Tax=uncultured Tenacibaculum sp. TaxID=174713 RepID=UPI00261FB780|nr:UvrD-helicase domain-containing protein [uncultured Tenacibaculum sp.]